MIEGDNIRVGLGVDAHRYAEGENLVLGGTEIESRLGTVAHSDGDVLTHAICDAILGAIGSGDIGNHFSDSDPKYRNISSLKLLKHVISKAKEEGFSVNNIDCTIMAETPRLSPFREQMQKNLGEICDCPVNVKFTTLEGLGFVGRKEGIAAKAVACLNKTQ